MLAFGQTPHVGWPLGLQPSAIIILQCAMCSLAWRWRLQSALRADQESFSIESDPLLLDSKAPCQQLRVVLQLQGRTNWSISVYLWEKLCLNIIEKVSDSDPNIIVRNSNCWAHEDLYLRESMNPICNTGLQKSVSTGRLRIEVKIDLLMLNWPFPIDHW